MHVSDTVANTVAAAWFNTNLDRCAVIADAAGSIDTTQLLAFIDKAEADGPNLYPAEFAGADLDTMRQLVEGVAALGEVHDALLERAKASR